MSEMNQLRWRCRRGMKELDRAMLAYLELCYESAPESEQAVFKDILAMQDPDLYLLVTQKTEPETEELAYVFQRIRDSLAAKH